MPSFVARRSGSLVSIALALALGVALTSLALSRPAGAQQVPMGTMESLVLEGNLDVQLMLDPRTGAPSTDWNGLLRRVERITIVDQYIIVQDSRGGATGRLVIPREQIVWLNIGQR